MSHDLLLAALAVSLLMWLLWALQTRTKDASNVDAAWALAIGGCAVWYAASGSGDLTRRWLAAGLIALWALRLKGWRLLARRYKTHVGEVDLIMRRGDVTAFIEVKARKNLDRAVESVTPRQARRIAAAARQFMAEDRRAALQACRFDIVAVSPYHWPQHIENAFEGDG